jgi:hypothetical protein
MRFSKIAAAVAITGLLALSATAGLGSKKPISLFAPANAHATVHGTVIGPGGGDSCTTESDFFNDYSSNGTIGIQMHIKCSSSGALIKGTIACIQEWVPLWSDWGNLSCWGGQGYGVLVIGGFIRCYPSQPTGTTRIYRGEASFDVTFPDGYHTTFSPVTAERGIQCEASTGSGF